METEKKSETIQSENTRKTVESKELVEENKERENFIKELRQINIKDIELKLKGYDKTDWRLGDCEIAIKDAFIRGLKRGGHDGSVKKIIRKE